MRVSVVSTHSGAAVLVLVLVFVCLGPFILSRAKKTLGLSSSSIPSKKETESALGRLLSGSLLGEEQRHDHLEM